MGLYLVKATVIVQADDDEGAVSVAASILDVDDVLEFRIEDAEAIGVLLDRLKATTTKGAT